MIQDHPKSIRNQLFRQVEESDVEESWKVPWKIMGFSWEKGDGFQGSSRICMALMDVLRICFVRFLRYKPSFWLIFFPLAKPSWDLKTEDICWFCMNKYGGFHKWAYPKWRVYNGTANPSINGWFGGTPIHGQPHITSRRISSKPFFVYQTGRERPNCAFIVMFIT